ncbi:MULTISPECIES: hypothetical protein [Paenibacillus]|uniref:Lipoprotein n=1 Tax=Paenibacillus pabuli TaxID=1472 RepID=A0A855YCP8_9BACL|nr:MULTISPECIES: hypothetical protein [Paenibacillus]PWW44958.1 hypothetical protein DET56_101158 [Paenibacillus pabuli]PXW11294.1 hypothetical protein DEU73_101157 [Paenibacillus taichungensis]
MRKNNNVLRLSISILILIVAMSLTGCSKLQTRISLMGESDHWRGELDTTVTSGRTENGAYTIFYKKDNLENIKDYKININEGRIIRKESDLTSKSIHFPITATRGSQVSRNEDQSVVIEWTDMKGNNFEEKFILREK